MERRLLIGQPGGTGSTTLPMRIDDLDLEVTSSIGVARSREVGPAHEVVRAADRAMYLDKRTSRRA